MNPLPASLLWRKLHKLDHEQFNFQPACLFINKEFPHIGASPDGLITCLCCGDSLIEIKCPYKHCDKDPTKVIDKYFCLQPDSSGNTYYIHVTTIGAASSM